MMNNNVLIISCSLLHNYIHTEMFVKSMHTMLTGEIKNVDIRDVHCFDMSSFSQYNTVLFIYELSMGTLPSVAITLLKQLETVSKHADIYCIAATDLYEPEACEISCRQLERWAQLNHLNYMGSLMIGSLYLQNYLSIRMVTKAYLKRLSKAIKENSQISLQTTCFSMKQFMKLGNIYWKKEIKKKQKELSKKMKNQ